MNPLAERRQEEKERRRLEILDAAEAVAAVVGFESMTMDLVARKARLSRALLYVYFKDKSDLLVGLCTRALGMLHQRFTVAVTDAPHGLAEVEACGRSYVDFAREFPVRFEALAHFEAHTPSAELDPAYDECMATGDRAKSVLVAAIERGKRDGTIRAEAGEATVLGFALWGLMHGVIQLTLKKSGGLIRAGISTDELIEQGFTLALSALAAAGQRS